MEANTFDPKGPLQTTTSRQERSFTRRRDRTNTAGPRWGAGGAGQVGPVALRTKNKSNGSERFDKNVKRRAAWFLFTIDIGEEGDIYLLWATDRARLYTFAY